MSVGSSVVEPTSSGHTNKFSSPVRIRRTCETGFRERYGEFPDSRHPYLHVENYHELKFIQCNFVFQLSWAATFPIVKIAVLIFYNRLFPRKPFRWIIYGTGAFLSLMLLCGLLGMVLQCRPTRSIWQPGVEHRCFNQLGFYIAIGSLNLVTDVFVVLMPIPILWSLHLPPTRKSGLVAVFLLAGV